MRGQLLLTVLLIACGGSPKPAQELPPLEPAAPATGVIDVAELTPLTGFSSISSRRTSGAIFGLDAAGAPTSEVGDLAADRTYSVRVGPDKLTVTFQAATDTSDGAVTPSPLADHAYAITNTAVAHADGTALTAQESAALTMFFQTGGLGIPVRDALVGKRLEPGQPMKLTALELSNLVVVGAPADATGEVTLQGVDADGLATLTFEGAGTIPQFTGSWAIEGTVTAEAATLNPRSTSFAITVSASNDDKAGTTTTTTTQTFTY